MYSHFSTTFQGSVADPIIQRMFAMKKANRSLECHPLTPERWADFETLFGERGACGGGLGMVWRGGPRPHSSGESAPRPPPPLRPRYSGGSPPPPSCLRYGTLVPWCPAPRRQ